MRGFAKWIVLASVIAMPSSALAQMDMSGSWGARFNEDQPERIPGPELGDYLGLPITDGARQWALSWDPSRLTLPEHQCQVHVSPYIYRGPLQLRIWEERDPDTQVLIAIKHYISTYEQTRTIWMDGRPHPPEYAAHTWQGFSTGKFDGDMLTVTTTHLKMGWIRRNGVPRSDTAVLTEHFVRHDNVLTLITVISDPLYLSEPFVRTTNWSSDPHQLIAPYPCQAVVEIERPQGIVPNHLPGTNTFLGEFAVKYKLPLEPTRGGAETMYPEYVMKLQTMTPAVKAANPAK